MPDGAAPAGKQDTAVIDASYETLFLVVDKDGGRITAGFDPKVGDATRRLQFGAFGAFIDRPLTAPSSPFIPSAAAAATTYRLRVVYNDLDKASAPRVGVPYAKISSIRCWGTNRAWSYTTYPPGADANGYITYNCGAGPAAGGVTIDPPSLYHTHSFVSGPGGGFVGNFTEVYSEPTYDVQVVAESYASRVFERLEQYAPIAQARFGYARPDRVEAWVYHANSPGIFYRADQDRIYTNTTRVFDNEVSNSQIGTWTTIHEFGHSYHWYALEPWPTYDCSPGGNGHSIGSLETFSCAFVEGFADFLATWVAGDRLRNLGTDGSWISDYRLEINPYRTTANGAFVEGSVAAFWYDLVDGVSEPNSATNTSDGDESFDTANYPGSYIATLIRTCQVNALTRLDGIDQFVYCAERNLAARNQGLGWRAYSSFSEGATEPNGWSPTVIRRLWRYNLYNVAP